MQAPQFAFSFSLPNPCFEVAYVSVKVVGALLACPITLTAWSRRIATRHIHDLLNMNRTHNEAFLAGNQLQPAGFQDSSDPSSHIMSENVNLATSNCQLEAIKLLHSTLDPQTDYLERSACQTAAGRALWNHVIHDPLAEVFAGDVFLKTLQEKIRRDLEIKARETAGVMLAVRTLWFDTKLTEALSAFGPSSGRQVVLLGAGKFCCWMASAIVSLEL